MSMRLKQVDYKESVSASTRDTRGSDTNSLCSEVSLCKSPSVSSSLFPRVPFIRQNGHLLPRIAPSGGEYPSGVRVRVYLSRKSSELSSRPIHWWFSMSPAISNYCNSSSSFAMNSGKEDLIDSQTVQAYGPGPTITGRIPARSEYPFEDGYDFSETRIGYHQQCSSSHPFCEYNFDFSLPGKYILFASTSPDLVNFGQCCVFHHNRPPPPSTRHPLHFHYQSNTCAITTATTTFFVG